MTLLVLRVLGAAEAPAAPAALAGAPAAARRRAMTRDRHGRSLGRALLDTLWQAPLWAIPFALFFGTMFGGRCRATCAPTWSR